MEQIYHEEMKRRKYEAQNNLLGS